MQGFTKSVKARAADATPVIDFFIETFQPDLDDKGNEQFTDEGVLIEKTYRRDDFKAKKPNDDVILLAYSDAMSQDSDMADEAGAMFDLLRAALSDNDIRTLRSRLRDEKDALDWEMLGEIVLWLMEQWSDFPTTSPSASSTSQASSGPKLTGRVRGEGSIR